MRGPCDRSCPADRELIINQIRYSRHSRTTCDGFIIRILRNSTGQTNQLHRVLTLVISMKFIKCETELRNNHCTTQLSGSAGVRPPVTGLLHSDENVGAGISLQPAISPHTGNVHRSLRWFYGTVKPPPMQIESSRIIRGSRQTAGQHRRILIYCQ